MRVSVVMPVFNEEKTVETIIGRVLRAPGVFELVVVDDASTDSTSAALGRVSDPRVRAFRHDRNQGKGAALRTAFGKVQGDLVIIQDADLEYDPSDYARLLAPIEAGLADVVYGSRFSGETHRVLFFWHYVGNRLLTTLSNMFTNLNLTDMETCYKACRVEVVRSLSFRSNRFGIEPEITAKIARHGFRVYETSISYHGRDYAAGKKITWRDGFRALVAIVYYHFFD
ncbi:MAG TPA: glycosyltransferase family 2 protein [Candidatus Polarisedimenticolia bacterium]|jgi:glycosyltransferase involved in cell wall biosynthesis|nr:glycosyltransferase family 2 protein [Candidatus Polarisedimenticolia bacterium]